MRFLKIFFVATFISVAMIACKTESKKETTAITNVDSSAKVKETSFNVSGMTCEIGCARKIASDLSKKDGVIDAKVVFNDGIATVKFDANKTNKAELMNFVDGMANNMYKTSDISKKSCKKECAKKCCTKSETEKKECEASCKKECCSKNEKDKKECSSSCKKTCCSKKA